MVSQQGTTTLAEASQRKMELQGSVPASLSMWDLVGTADLGSRELV